MSDSTTVARPYAKAIAEYARQNDSWQEWSDKLSVLAQALKLDEAVSFITNPSTTEEQHVSLLMTLVKKQFNDKASQTAENLLRLLAHNKRLCLLPEIQVQFESLKAQHDKTQKVEVISYSKLTEQQLQQLSDSLSKRLERKVLLEPKVDSALLGGAIIRAGDLVIDGSVRDKLNKLKVGLTA